MLMTWGAGGKTTHFKLPCVQRDGRGTSERAYLGGGTAESAHKDAPGCCWWGTWKSCSAISIAPCTQSCAGSSLLGPGSRRCQGTHTSFRRSGNPGPKKRPLRSLPWNISSNSPEMTPNCAEGSLPAAPSIRGEDETCCSLESENFQIKVVNL